MRNAYIAGRDAAFQKLGVSTRGRATLGLLQGAWRATNHVLDPVKAVGGAAVDTVRGVTNFFTPDVRHAFRVSAPMAAKEIALPAMRQGANRIVGEYGPRVAAGVNTWLLPG